MPGTQRVPAGGGKCLYVPTEATTSQSHGLLKVLHSDGVPPPCHFALMTNTVMIKYIALVAALSTSRGFANSYQQLWSMPRVLHVSAGGGNCLFVPTVATTSQYHGLLKVLRSDGVPPPHHYALVSNPCCMAGCVLEWESAHDARDAQHTVCDWVERTKALRQVCSSLSRVVNTRHI
jgi:hypothetical protein